MPDRNAEIGDRIPVGIAEVFLWSSWRTWAMFLGTALVIGGLGAGLAFVVRALELRSTGFLETLVTAGPAIVIGYAVLVFLTNRMIALLWNADMLDDEIVSKPGISVGFRNRDDYMLALMWLCCMPVVLVFGGIFVFQLAGFDDAIFEDGMDVFTLMVLLVVMRVWERVLDGVLKRIEQ